MTDKRPFPLPTGYFAIPLGLGALSLAWLHMAIRSLFLGM